MNKPFAYFVRDTGHLRFASLTDMINAQKLPDEETAVYLADEQTVGESVSEKVVLAALDIFSKMKEAPVTEYMAMYAALTTVAPLLAAQPEPSVPVSKLRELVTKFNTSINLCTTNDCADEIESLIASAEKY